MPDAIVSSSGILGEQSVLTVESRERGREVRSPKPQVTPIAVAVPATLDPSKAGVEGAGGEAREIGHRPFVIAPHALHSPEQMHPAVERVGSGVCRK